MRDSAAGVKYIEFVLTPQDVFDAFTAAAGRVGLDEIQGAGGPAVSEPHAEEHALEAGAQRSLHYSSQAAQPTESGSQTGGAAARGARGVWRIGRWAGGAAGG